MKGAFVLLLAGIALQAAVVSGWGSGWNAGKSHSHERHGKGWHGGQRGRGSRGGVRGGGAIVTNWDTKDKLKNFKVDVPGFFMPGVEIHGFMKDGWFPDFGKSDGTEGFVVGRTQFKPASAFNSFRVRGGNGGFQVNGRFVPLKNMRSVFEYYIYNRIQDRLTINGLPKLRLEYGKGVPPFYVDNIEIPGFAKDGLFPGFRYTNKKESGFEIDGRFQLVGKFPSVKIMGRRAKFELNGLRVSYEDLKLKLDNYFRTGGTVEKLKLTGFDVQKKRVKPNIQGFVIPGLEIPGFTINGRFPSIKYEGRTPGFIISGQFVPGTEFEAFQIKDNVPGLIVNGKWYPYDANLKKYLLSLGPKFAKLEIPGFTIKIKPDNAGGETTPAPATEPPAPPEELGFLNFIIRNGVPGFKIKGVFIPGWKFPGFQINGGSPGFLIDGVFRDLNRIKIDLPSFELPSLTIPEITFPSYTVKPIPGGGSITGISVKGFFIPGDQIPGFSVSKHQPGLIIKGKFVPLSQIPIQFPGFVLKSPNKDKYPDLVFPGVTKDNNLKIDKRLIPLELIPNYHLVADVPSIQINNEYVPIYQIPIRFPSFQITIPAAEFPAIKFPGFEIRGGVPGFTINGQWVPGTEIRGFQIRANIPGFVINGKHVPLHKLPADFKLPQPIPQFIIRGKVPGLILNGNFVPGFKIPGFTVEFNVPGFKVDGKFYPLNNLPEKFVIPDIKVTNDEKPIFTIKGGIPGLIISGKFIPGDHFPGFTIVANIPGFRIDGQFVPLSKVEPSKIPKPEEPKQPTKIPVFVIKGTVPGVIINGGFVPGDKLPGFKIVANIPGITIDGKFTPLKDIPVTFKWPEPEPQTTITIVTSNNVPGIILHGTFTPISELPDIVTVANVPGITIHGVFTPLTDLTSDNIPRPPTGIITFTIKNGVPGITVNNEKFYPAEKINGFTIRDGVPGIIFKGEFYPINQILSGKFPDVKITIITELPKPKFPEFIIKGSVPGLLINGKFIDGDYIKDFYMVDVDYDGIPDPVFYIDRKYVPIKEVPQKYPNYQIVILDKRKSELIPKFEIREGIPGLILNDKFIPGKWITDFVVENKEPGFKVILKPGDKEKKFVPLKELPFKVPGYTIEVNRPAVVVKPTPTVYNGQFGFIVNDVFYPATKIPGVEIKGEWPLIEVPIVIPGYPGEKPKFTIKDWKPGFIVRKDIFIPLTDVPGVLFVDTDLIIISEKPTVIPIFGKDNKLPTIEFTFGIPGIDLPNIPGVKPTKPPEPEPSTTPEPPRVILPDFVEKNGVPGLIINGIFYPGSSIINFRVEEGVPGFIIKGKFIQLIELPDKAPGYVIQLRPPGFPEFKIVNDKPGLQIGTKFFPHTFIKNMIIKNNHPYFKIKGKEVPLNEVPDNYRFEIQIPKDIKIIPTIAYGEIGFIINDLFYPGSRIPGLKISGTWPKVEVPGVKIPGHEKDTPTFTIKDFVPGFLFKDNSFIPAISVPGVDIDGFQITIPGAKIPTIQFPGFEFTLGIPGLTLDIPSTDVKPVPPTTTTTPKPEDAINPPGWPRFTIRDGTPGLIINGKFVPGDRIHRFRVKDDKPGFEFDGKFIPYKEVPKEKKDFTLTVLPPNWPRFDTQNKIPGLILNGRFTPGKYIKDFTVKNNVPGFDIKGTFVPLDDLIDKQPDYQITIDFGKIPVPKVTIYDGEIGFIIDDKFYPGSKTPGLQITGNWPKVQVPGLKIPGFEKDIPVFTIQDFVPGFIVPNHPFIPAKNVPGVVFDGVTIILPGAQIPTIQFPGFEFTVGFPGVNLDVPGIDVKDFTTRAPATTTPAVAYTGPYTSPPGLPKYVIVNGVPGLIIQDKFIPGPQIKHFKVENRIPGFVVDGTFVPYHDYPKLNPIPPIQIIPDNYPKYVVQNKRPGLIFNGKFVPAEWIKDFVVPKSDDEEPGFTINGLFIPLIDLFDKSPGYNIQIQPPPVNPQITIINGEIGFIIFDKFYPGSKIPGLQVSGVWPKVPVPGFKIPGYESETPLFTIEKFVPGFIVKPNKFIPAKNVPGVKFNGINIVLEGAHIPTIQFPGFEFTLGIPGAGLDLPDVAIEVEPTKPPQVNKPEFVVRDKVPGLVVDGTFYPGTIIKDFTIRVNEPGFIISGEFVPLKFITDKYPDYRIQIIKVPDVITIRPEFAIIDGVIGVIVNDIFYPGNKIPGVNIAGNWPRVEIPGLKIKDHENETPILTVKDFTIGFIVKPDKFIPVTQVPQVKIVGSTITIEGVNIPTISFPGFEFTLGIPGVDIKIPDGKPLSRPTNPPVSDSNLPEFKIVGKVPGLVIFGKFIPGVFIKDFTVIEKEPGFIIDGKFVPLKDVPKKAPKYTIQINIEVRPTLTFHDGIIGFEVNKQFIPGNQIPGLIVEGKWPEIELPGVEIPGKEKETPVFTVRDWVPGFIIKGEFIPATQIPGFNIINNVIVIPGWQGVINFPTIDFTGIITILRPKTTQKPLTSVTPPTHFLGFDIVEGIPGFKINGVWIPGSRIPGFRVKNNVPGIVIKGRWIPLVDIEIKFPGLKIIVNGDNVVIEIPGLTTPAPTGPNVMDVEPGDTTPAGAGTTKGPKPQTTVGVPTKPDHTIDWTEFGKIVYNIAYKWERIRESFMDVCYMAKPTTIETVLKKQIISPNALSKIRFFNEPFGHYIDALINTFIPDLVSKLEPCGSCVKTPIIEFIDRVTEQFCIDLRKQPIIPFVPDAVPTLLRTAVEKSYPTDERFGLILDLHDKPLAVLADAVKKVKREAALEARRNRFERVPRGEGMTRRHGFARVVREEGLAKREMWQNAKPLD